ncbi:MAG: hypothetical protein NVSMB27_23280 [Ktedonobacteraceae bacterium]
MHTPFARKTRQSFVRQVKTRQFFTAGVFMGMLIAYIVISISVYITQSNLGEQKVTLHDDINGILSSMVNQETGLRGYIAANNTVFLDPFTTGRSAYLSALQQFKNQVNSSSFSETAAALAQVEGKADDWYTGFAQVQLKDMQSGDLITPRKATTAAMGKARFDQFRAAVARLQQTTDRDLTNLQQRNATIDILALVVSIGLSALLIIILWRVFTAFAGTLREHLGALEEAANQLGAGDLATRVQELSYQELNRLGQTFNSMAGALQQQQKDLQERDILENVLQLNTVLAKSLDLNTLADGFLNKALSLLDLHLGALYLYDPDRSQLTLHAAQGIAEPDLQPTFQLGEGPVGRAASCREPLLLTQPESDQAERFEVRTALGLVLPASLYQLPLLVGNELLGVLVAGSIYPMREQAGYVLKVVTGSLSATLSNARAYLHMQKQARELEERNDALTRLNARLVEASRARSQFISTMSHELRTPLTSILGFSQMLLQRAARTNGNQRDKDELGRILKNGKHLLALVNGVLDIAKIESGRLDVLDSRVDLRALLSSLVEEMQVLAPDRQLVLRSEVEAGADFLETDAMKLRQVLLNLVSNAVKFTAHGEVTITATRALCPHAQGVPGIAIAVRDSGIGIPAELQERIFEAFYQVDEGNMRKYGGTGLGLAIVGQLTTLLGGTVTVASQPGQGSTFTVTFPIQRERSRPGAQQELEAGPMLQTAVPRLLLAADDPATGVPNELVPALGPNGASGRERLPILAVDDNADVLNLIASLLDQSPYEVVGVQDPLQVIQMAQEVQPCAITLDVMMPQLNGWQLLYELKTRAETAHIPVILLTILAERTTGYVLGADDYLVKPFERDALLEALQRVVARRPRAHLAAPGAP